MEPDIDLKKIYRLKRERAELIDALRQIVRMEKRHIEDLERYIDPAKDWILEAEKMIERLEKYE